jgi:hypothetical protein
MDVDANHRTRRVMILAGLAVIAVIAAAAAGMTWFSGRPGSVSSRPAATSSSPGRSPATPSSPGASPITPSGSGPPNGRVAAPDLAGGWDSTIGVYITFSPDGTWLTIGGCNSGTGTWRSTANGGLTLTITSRTRLPCPLTAGSDGVPAGDTMLGYLQATTRVQAGTASGRPQLTLFDRRGGQLVRLLRQTATTSRAPAPAPGPALRALGASGSCPACSA